MEKNFKVWKVVSVGSDGLAETQKGCELLESLEQTINSEPPPVYADQGQPRGRKPSAKSKVKGKNGVKKAKKSSKKGGNRRRAILRKALSSGALSLDPNVADATGKNDGKSPPKTTRVLKKKKKAAVATGGSTPVEVVPSKKRRVRGEAKTTPSSEPSCPEPKPEPSLPREEIPKDAIDAPPHVTGNQVYSNAYKKKKYQGGTAEDCKKAGKLASALLRDYNLVSPRLSGVPKEPKADKSQPKIGDHKNFREGGA